MRSWNEAWRNRSFRNHIILTGVLLLLLVLLLPSFFNDFLQNKPGVQLSDWVLNQFIPRDFSWPIFILIYSAIICFLLRNYNDPIVILVGLEAYLTLQFLRILTLTFFTLEPPPGIIPLTDPFISMIAYGTEVFNKDLFFSGHTATLFLLGLLENSRAWKWVFLIFTFIVALLIMIQHVHYTIDIVGAPLASWVAWRAGHSLTKSFRSNS